MSIITKMLKQEAIYWPPVSADNYGQPTFGSPVEIACRWEDVQKEILTPEGEEIISSTTVYVDRDVEIGGALLLGTLSSSVNEGAPLENEGSRVIRQFDKLPTFKATEFLRTVYL